MLPGRTTFASQAAGTTVVIQGFAELRQSILTAIGSARERIWISTQYLTDGDVVSALFVARYRKIDVSVLIGAAKANDTFSRMSFLRDHNIPVFLRPRDFYPQIPSAILTDRKLVFIDADLDYRAKYRKFSLTDVQGAGLESFVQAFAAATQRGVVPVPAPVPLVGRGFGKGRVYDPKGASMSGGVRGGSASGAAEGRAGPDGAYHYGAGERRAPEGVSVKLPRETVVDRLERERKEPSSAIP